MIPNTNSVPRQGGNKSKNNGTIVASAIAGIIIVAAVLFYIFVYHPNQVRKQAEQAPPPDTMPVVEDTPADTIPVTNDANPVMTDEVALRYDSDPNVDKGFFIIIGSFRSKNNAARFAAKLSSDIDTEVLYFTSPNLYRVACGKYRNLHAAWNDRLSILDLPGCSEAWILENR